MASICKNCEKEMFGYAVVVEYNGEISQDIEPYSESRYCLQCWDATPHEVCELCKRGLLIDKAHPLYFSQYTSSGRRVKVCGACIKTDKYVGFFGKECSTCHDLPDSLLDTMYGSDGQPRCNNCAKNKCQYCGDDTLLASQYRCCQVDSCKSGMVCPTCLLSRKVKPLFNLSMPRVVDFRFPPIGSQSGRLVDDFYVCGGHDAHELFKLYRQIARNALHNTGFLDGQLGSDNDSSYDHDDDEPFVDCAFDVLKGFFDHYNEVGTLVKLWRNKVVKEAHSELDEDEREVLI